MNLKRKIVDKSINYIKSKKLSKRKAILFLFWGLIVANIAGFFENITRFVCNRKKIFAITFGVLAIAFISVTYFFYVRDTGSGVPEKTYYNTQETVDLSVGNILETGRSFVTVEVSEFKYYANENRYYLKVNRQMNYVTVYTYDTEGNYTVPVKSMVCSVGREGHKTPEGTYTLGDRARWCYLVNATWGQYATRISGPIMFHSVPYEAKSNDTLEYEEYNKLGEAASLGCVRLNVENAKWIFDNCPRGTVVEIYDSSDECEIGLQETIELPDGAGWDPTDPEVEQ